MVIKSVAQMNDKGKKGSHFGLYVIEFVYFLPLFFLHIITKYHTSQFDSPVQPLTCSSLLKRLYQ